MDNRKGVTVSVIPKADMPTDEFGNVADVAMFGGSAVHRMTTAQMHEHAVGAAGRDVVKRIRRKLGVGDFEQVTFDDMLDLVERTPDVSTECYQYLLGYYEIVATDTEYPWAKSLIGNGNRWLRHLATVIESGNDPKGVFIHINVGSDVVKMDEVIAKLADGPYMPEMSVLRFRNPGDKDYTYTKTPGLIGTNYMLPLEKTATDYSGVSSCKVGHFGTTSRLTQQDKYSRPGRETSTRTTGEDEIRNLSKSVGAEHIANINDMHNNPTVHKEVCRTILEADMPTNIDRVVDREKYPIGGHRPLGYAHHLLTCSGKGFRRP